MDGRRLGALRAMGIPVWVRRDLPGEPADGAGPGPDVAAMDWPELEATVAACVRCPLYAGRTRTVFGVGNRAADLMVIGEAPGAEEDRRGEPFVGRAGRLLDSMLAALGLDRTTVYIANVLKCRPPENRDPRPEEARACAPYLDRQIALLAPKLILAVGRIAAQRLLETDASLGRMRGRVHRYGEPGVPVMVTYHPAYLLRNPQAKAEAWRDLVEAARRVREAGQAA